MLAAIMNKQLASGGIQKGADLADAARPAADIKDALRGQARRRTARLPKPGSLQQSQLAPQRGRLRLSLAETELAGSADLGRVCQALLQPLPPGDFGVEAALQPGRQLAQPG